MHSLAFNRFPYLRTIVIIYIMSSQKTLAAAFWFHTRCDGDFLNKSLVEETQPGKSKLKIWDTSEAQFSASGVWVCIHL